MEFLKYTLLGALILCAIITAISRKLLVTIIVFMAYSLMMSIVWVLLESPDLAITEAAVGAGVDTILVLSGEATVKDLEASPVKPTYVLNSVSDIKL